MGPNLIFDKSFLQSLNPDESVWLDAFFYTNIVPLFYIETLADLEKEVSKGRSPEQVVGNLALKTPDSSVASNIHHRTLLIGELSNTATIDMQFGRPIVGGSRDTFVNGKRGAVFEQSPEEAALERWQLGKFLQLERDQAKEWRQALSMISPKDQQSMFPGWYGNQRPSNLATVKAESDAFIDGENKRSALTFGLSLLDFPKDAAATIIQRWESDGCPELAEFAPYFRHVYGIDLFFFLARSADLISQRRTNKVDIAYLYYLPFCMVFVSNDKLHKETVPLFLRNHQSFVWGLDLKKDLTLLDRHYCKLPEDVKERGLHYFASYPPIDKTFLVTRLWDQHMRPDWRDLNKGIDEKKDKSSDSALIAMLQRAADAPQTDRSKESTGSDDVDYIVTKHYVRRKKGKWNRFPPEVDQTAE